MSDKQLITHSRIAAFKTCRRKHFFSYELGWRKETDPKALRMGSAFHIGVDKLKTTNDLDQAILAVRECYDYVPDHADGWEWIIERETVECLVTGYQWRWSDDRLKVLSSEQAFRIPLVNPETGASTQVWDLAGKIDGIVTLPDGRTAVLEHKLVSDPLDLEGDFWRRLQLDHQITLYLYAARQLGWNATTVFYDVVRKPTIRPEQVPVLDELNRKIILDRDGNRVWKVKLRNGQSEPRQSASKPDGHVLLTRVMTTEEWASKLLEDIRIRPQFYYQRWEIPRLDRDIDEMLLELWDIQQTLRDAQLRNRWYKTVSRDTCNYCSYFGLCASGYSNWSETPEGFFRLDDMHPELTLEVEEERISE